MNLSAAWPRGGEPSPTETNSIARSGRNSSFTSRAMPKISCGAGLRVKRPLRRARAQLGSLAAGRENCRAASGSRFLDELWTDLRYALRMLARSPGFAAIAVGSLALGIGVNTVLFTAAQHMLLDRLAVPHPEQLRLLAWTEPKGGAVESLWGWFDDLPGGGETSTSFSYPVYQQLRKQNSAMAEPVCVQDTRSANRDGRWTCRSGHRGDGVRQLLLVARSVATVGARHSGVGRRRRPAAVL